MTLASSDDIPDTTEFVFGSDLPFAIKLDPKDWLPGRLEQATIGVYQGIAAVAAMPLVGEA